MTGTEGCQVITLYILLVEYAKNKNDFDNVSAVFLDRTLKGTSVHADRQCADLDFRLVGPVRQTCSKQQLYQIRLRQCPEDVVFTIIVADRFACSLTRSNIVY